MKLFVQSYGVTCPLGLGKQAVAAALFAGQADALSPRDDLLAGRTVLVGAVTAKLPAVPAVAADLDCRNNRLMMTALAEIQADIAKAIARHGAERIAVVCGTSTSGIAESEAALTAYRHAGAWPASFHYRQQETGNLGLFVARALGLRGPAYTIATACSSSAKVFAAARRLIRAGMADAAIVGGADTLCGMTLGGFASLEALSATRCNPFSVNRDGITIGEGAAAFLLGPQPGPIELLGIGENSDAHHPTAPDPTGAGAHMAMQEALRDADLAPDAITYVNLHGTATPLNDAMESRAIHDLFGPDTPCGSTKGMTGHMLGATGGVEAAFLCLSLQHTRLPPHLWDGQADPALPRLNLWPQDSRIAAGRQVMLSNSFGFGGSNAALILGAA